MADSPGTQVLHNTILTSRTYANPIEYRFPDTTGVIIANNVLDGAIAARNGASGTVSGNYTNATAALFVNPASGDLHLTPAATAILDQVAMVPTGAAVDWDGDARPAGAVDLGADEHRSGPGTLPSAPHGLRLIG